MTFPNTRICNLSIAKRITFFVRDVCKLRRSNASDQATFHPDPILGIKTDSDAAGYLQYLERHPTHQQLHATLNELDRIYCTDFLQRVQQIASVFMRPQLKTPLSYISDLAIALRSIKVCLEMKPIPRGGCNQFVGFVMGVLLLKKIPFECFFAEAIKDPKTHNHLFIVMGRQPGSDLRDIRTWGEQAVIIDAWDQFRCVTATEAVFQPKQYPFFDIQYKSHWRWSVLLAQPTTIFDICNAKVKKFFEEEIQNLIKRHIPENFDLAETTTEPETLLNVCGILSEKIPSYFRCQHSKKLLMNPVRFSDGASLVHFEKSEVAGIFSEKMIMPNAGLRRQIIKYLYDSAIKENQYDFYRLEFSRKQYLDINIRKLVEFSTQYQNSKGYMPLIKITPELVSINRLWFEYELVTEVRESIKKLAKLPNY